MSTTMGVRWTGVEMKRLSYSVGMTITDAIHQAVLKVPASAWTPAIEPDDEIRDGARAAEPDGGCLIGGPKAMRLTVRKERPRPGTPLRFTDTDGLRPTLLRHQHQEHPDRRAGTAPSPARPHRRPHPHRPRNRPAPPSTT
jgi:hypothetical protein